MKFVLLCVLRNGREGPGNEGCNQSLVDLCKDLLSSLDVLDPGASRNRGKILKDLVIFNFLNIFFVCLLYNARIRKPISRGGGVGWGEGGGGKS